MTSQRFSESQERDKLLDEIRRAVEPAVVKTGDEACFNFRNPRYEAVSRDNVGKNPIHQVDIDAGTTLIQTLDDKLAPIAEAHGYELRYLTEELTKFGFRTDYEANLHYKTFKKVSRPEDFFGSGPFEKVIRSLNDPCDGTECFNIGRPDWSVASVIILGHLPRLTVMYEPAAHTLTVACLKGNSEDIRAEAYIRDMSTGREVDLVTTPWVRSLKKINDAAVGYHLSRSQDEARLAFYPLLEKLIKRFKSVFENNCGSVSIREILTGELDAFVCNSVPLHDALMSIPIIKSIKGGRVTQFDGSEIKPSCGKERVSIIAAATPKLHEEILKIVGNPKAV